MPPAARVGDMHTCPLSDGPKPHVGGPITTGAPTVIIGGQPAARVGDLATCVGPPDSIAQGEPSVLIAGMLAARSSDMTTHGGVITTGCPTVLIGVPAGGTCMVKAPKVGAPFVNLDSANGIPVVDEGATNSTPLVDKGPANGAPFSGENSANSVPFVDEGSTSGAFLAEEIADSGQAGGFFSVVRNVAGRIWALPNTLIGLAYGGIGMLFGATPEWDSQNGILRFINMPKWMMPSAMSLGHVHVFSPGMYKGENGNLTLNGTGTGTTVAEEELLHTRQAEVLGPLYLPLHAISMGISILTGGGTHDNNLLERGPQHGTGPWPWS